MGFNYVNARATANRLLKNFGRTATLRRVTVGAYDETTGDVVNSTTSVAVDAVLLNYGTAEKAGGLVQAGDVKALVAVGTQTSPPRVGDELVLSSGVVYRVVTCSPLSPAEVDVLYELQLRK